MFEKSVKDWITNFLDKQNPAFNNLPPCPFAKQAMLDDKIVYHFLNPIDSLTMSAYISCELENFSYHWPKGKEVVVLGCDKQNISSDDLSDSVEDSMERFKEKLERARSILRKKDYYKYWTKDYYSEVVNDM